MSYGTIKVNTITFTNNGIDQSVTVSGLVASTSGNLTATGTISGSVIQGGTLVSGATVTGAAGQFTNLTAVSGVFTTQVSGATITGNVGQFTSLTGISAGFTTVTGTTVTGTTANFVTVSGTTVTGTTANFVTLSGTTVTGTTASFTSGVFTNLSGGVCTITSGVLAVGNVTNPSLSFDGDANTGIYSPNAEAIGFATNGQARLVLDADGQLEAASIGSASTPIYSFGSDPNTGMYSPGADQLAFSTNGTGRLFIDSSGNVGIGTTNPSSNLTVGGNPPTSGAIAAVGSAAGIALALSDNTNSSLYVRMASGGAIIGTDAGGALRFSTSGNDTANEKARIDDSGRLLVGTSVARANFFNSAISAAIQSEASGLGTDGRFLSVTNNHTSGTQDGGGVLILSRSGGTSNGSNTVVADANRLGQISFSGSDGSEFVEGARIDALVDGTPGANDMPGRLVFSTTADGAASPTERMRIDSSGNVGIGTNSPDEKCHIQDSTTSGTVKLGRDYYGLLQQSNNDLSIVSNGDQAYRVGLGTNDGTGNILFKTANGATGNTTRMAITAAGNVGIGTATPGAALEVAGNILVGANTGSFRTIGAADSSDTTLVLQGGAASGVGGNIELSRDGNNVYDGATHVFRNVLATSEYARIDSSGRLLVGTSSARANFFNAGASPDLQLETAGSIFSITRNSNTATDGSVAILARSRGTSVGSNTIVQSGDLIGRLSFQANDGTEFVEGALIQAEVDGTPGANDMPGRLVFSTTPDGASSPTERMRITQDGYVRIGKTSADVNVQGISLAPFGTAAFTRDGEIPLIVNRNTDDGALVVFRQAGTDEGSISVSGTAVSYNGAHLSRWSQLPDGAEREEILRGTVLSNIDEMCNWGEEDNEQLNRMQVSDVEGDPNVSGVFQAWDDDDDTYTDDFYCAMTGDFIIRIAEGVTVQRGDLLMSAGDGTAKPQDDDIIRSKTIAKVTSNHVTCTYDDGSYCVPCVLMAC